jgi:hypothetical protein
MDLPERKLLPMFMGGNDQINSKISDFFIKKLKNKVNPTSSDIKKIQEKVNDFVADINPTYVNKTTFFLKLKGK